MSKTTQVHSVKIASAQRLLQRIRNLQKEVEYGTKKLHRQKMEMYQAVYLYCETQVTKDGWLLMECYEHLVSAVGLTVSTWANYRNRGEFIRDNRLDLDSALPSSLAQVNAASAIEGRHLPRLVKMLNSSEGPSKIKQTLVEMGYHKLPPLPKWTRKMIRNNKKVWPDWDDEMADLLGRMRHTTDAKAIKMRLTLTVNGKPAHAVNL